MSRTAYRMQRSGKLRFPGGVIPQRAFSPAARGTLPFIPLPNQGVSQYVTSGQNRRVVDDKAGQRVDILTQSWGNWFVYYVFDDATVTNPLPASSVPGFPTVTPSRAQQAVLSNTKVFGPAAVNEARLTFTRSSVITDQPLRIRQGWRSWLRHRARYTRHYSFGAAGIRSTAAALVR